MIHSIELRERGNKSGKKPKQPFYLHMKARNGEPLPASQGYTRSSTALDIMAVWKKALPKIKCFDGRSFPALDITKEIALRKVDKKK